MKHFFLNLFVFLLALTSVTAQNNLRGDFKVPGGVPNAIHVCTAPDTAVFVIRTDGISTSPRTQITAALQLFRGIEIVGFLDQLSSPGIFVTSLVNKNRPVFSIPDLSPSGQSSVELVVLLAADCIYADTIMQNGASAVLNRFEFTYRLNGQLLSEVDQTAEYRSALKLPVLSIAAQSNVLPPTRAGQCRERSFTLANSSLEGLTDTVFYINRQGAGVSVSAVFVEGVQIPITKVPDGIDTIITAKIAGSYLQMARIGTGGMGNGNMFFDPNESITVKEQFCLISCAVSRVSKHSVAWGCKGRLCVSSGVDGFVQTGQGLPNALITHAANDPANAQVGYCKPGRLRIVYRNTGVAIDPGFADMTNVEVVLGMTNQLLLNHPYMTTTSITIAGVSVPLAVTTSLDKNPLFMTDPDGAGGLSDLDNDGFFDDLAPNQSFVVFVHYEFNCDNARMPGRDSLCLNEVEVVWNTQMRYTDPCGIVISKSLGNFGGAGSSNEEFVNCVDPDAYPNERFLVQHIETRGVRSFGKNCAGGERFVVWTTLPPGITASASDFKIFKNNSSFEIPMMNSYRSGDTLFMEYDATNPFLNGKYDIQGYYTPDCTVPAGRIKIPLGFQVYCPTCDCRHDWYCQVIEGPQFHPTVPPCPVGVSCPIGIKTTDFDVERTTFGFTSSEYRTKVTRADANLDVAIQCDSVRMFVNNVVGQTPVNDSLGVIISYDNVEFIKDTTQIFLFDKGILRINRGGTIRTCPIDKSMLKVTAGDTTKILKFEFSPCLAQLGITLQAGDSVNFIGDFMVNPKGPMVDNFRKVPNFRAYGFAVNNGDTLVCDNFGENFTVCKIPTVFAIPGGPDFPKGCSDTPFGYRLITKNVGFYDYFPNEFYPAVKVDSIVFEYDSTLVSRFSDINVEVSIPGHPIHGNNFFKIHPLSAADKGRYVAKFDTLVQFPSYNIVQSYSFNLQISVAPGCQSLTGSSNNNSNYKLDPIIHYADNYFARWYGDGSCSVDTTVRKTQNLTYSDPPTLSFEAVSNPSIFLASDTAEWIVKQCNTSTKSDALLTWMSTGFDTSQVQLVSVELIDNPSSPELLPIRYFGSGRAFVFTPAVFRQSSNNSSTQICNFLRIRAVPKICGTANIRLDMGWNCSPYDDPNWTPERYPPCVADTLGLQLTTLEGAVEATIIGQPPTFPSVCDTVSLELLVRNVGRGKLFDINSVFSIPLQAGDYVLGSAKIAYPSDAPFQNALGDPIPLGTTVKGRFYSFSNFDLLHAGLAANGLPGFDPNDPNTSNEFRVKYSFIAGCGFRGGAQVFYQFTGFQSCGQPSNFEAGESFPIYFNGLTPPIGKNFDPQLNLSSLLQSGTTSTLQIDVTNLTSTVTDTFDRISLKLPPGVNYVAGSSVAVKPSNWAVTAPTVRNIGGINIITWQMPSGLTLADTAKLRFDVTAPVLSCASQLEASLSTVRDTVLLCASGVQTCDASVITSGEEKFFNLSVGQNGQFAGGDKTLCAAGRVQLGAIANGYSNYRWEPAQLLDNPNIAMPTANIQSNTTFTVTAIDDQGCTRTDQVIVNISGGLNVQATATPARCGEPNGQISIVIGGGGSGNYTYQWIPTNLSGSNPQGLAAGTYTVVVTDSGSGCSASQSIVIPALGTPVVFSGLPTHPTVLQGGSISVLFSQGTAPYSVAWTGTNGQSGSETNINALGYVIQSLASGNYSVTVTDANGCFSSSSFTLNQVVAGQIMATITTQPDTSCCFSAGTGFLTIQGGTAPFQVVLSPANGSVQPMSAREFKFINLEAGTYQVSVTDANGATLTEAFTILDACQCAEIFEDDVIYDVSGIEALCLPLAFIDYPNYGLVVNGVPYTGPAQGCDIDTVVTYAFSYMVGNGFDGPYKLTSWYCNNVTISNVVFQDLYELVDSMNHWDPYGAWYLDDATSTIFGGDLDQIIYGRMEIMHMPTWIPYTAKVNYTDFAYGTEIFVNPFDDKYVIVAYDSTTCCSDTLCIILLNPCEQLIPQEPYAVTTQDPKVCLPLPHASVSNYLIFYNSNRVFQTTSCNGGNGSSFTVPATPGQYEMIVIDLVNTCADTVLVNVSNQPTKQVIPVVTLINTPVQLCGDTTELFGGGLSTNVCGIQSYGTLNLQSATCWNYTPNHNFVGIDTICLNTCDASGVCDTTIFVITVIPHIPTIDTIRINVIPDGNTINICPNTNQLIGQVVNVSICQQTNQGTLTTSGNGCTTYLPNLTATGNDQGCIIICDAIGLCDTTIVQIVINSNALPPTPDTLKLNTFVNIPIPNICPVLSQIGGVAANINYCGLAKHGTTTLTQSCVNYVPSFNYIGTDSFCVYVCNASGICDTTYVFITIEPDNTSGTTTDTLRIVTQANTPSQWSCLNFAQIGGTAVSFDLCAAPNFGTVTLNSPCFFFTPMQGYVGNDQFCVIACNAAGLCDTTIVLVTVEPPMGVTPTRDTIYITTPAGQTTSPQCVNLSQIGSNTSFSLCGNPNNGQVALSDPCFTYTPNSGFVGNDQFCLVACNTQNVCDTTIVIVTVTPTVTPPVTIDTIKVTTLINTPTANICVSTAQIGPSVTLSLCGNPASGQVALTNPCFVYTPNQGFVGNDQFCVVACNAAGICDTTIVLVTVNPIINPPPNGIDTIRLTTPFQTSTPSICLDVTMLNSAPISYQVCNPPNSGTLIQLNDTCVIYNPNTGFVGIDTMCVIICDNTQTCDTTIIIVTVLPMSAPDCGLFPQDNTTVEIFNGVPAAQVCVPLKLDSVPAFDWYLDGVAYTGPFVGCNFDSCFDYTYFTIPDMGDKGPYLMNYWVVNGTKFSFTFQDVEALVDSMNVIDPLGKWTLNQSRLTIVSCERTPNKYGDMRITQLSSNGIGVLNINTNLVPKGTAVFVPIGNHTLIVNGDDGCADTLNVMVQPAKLIEIDTFIYINSGTDTLCLTDYGVRLQGITSLTNLCPGAAGADITYALDTTTLCLTYAGRDLGQDSLCLKLGYGQDSCVYVNILITVLEPLPCIDFISETSTNGALTNCNGSDTVMICVNIPFALAGEFRITAGGRVRQAVECPPDALGIPRIGVVFDKAGMYELVFDRYTMNCKDSISVVIACPDDISGLVDTIELGQTDSICFDVTLFPGTITSIVNLCPSNSGTFVNFGFTNNPYCVTYTGLALGMESACVQICDNTGYCDTVLVQVTVVPPASRLPEAVTDYDTIRSGVTVTIPIYANDKPNGTLTGTRIITQPKFGTVVLNATDVVYTADTSKCATRDSFLYEICNAQGCDTAWVYISMPCMRFQIYTGFSPNGDMINDFFHIDGLEMFPGHRVIIFNRWGAQVLNRAPYLNDWGGTWNGKDLPDGVYFYIFEDGNGNRISGNVTIMR